jgi:hypothetical protein
MALKFNVGISRVVVKKPYSTTSKLVESTRKPRVIQAIKNRKIKQLTKNNQAFLRSLKLL